MSSVVHLLDPPDILEAPSQQMAIPKGVLQDVADEVGKQLLRRFISAFGSNLALADGVALYSNQVAACRSVYNVTHNKDGSLNKSPRVYGFIFESLAVGEQNRDAIIQKTGVTYDRVDDLYYQQCKDGEKLPHEDLESLATFNNPYTDVVGYDESGIKSKQQLKAEKDTRGLLEERYTISQDDQAPDVILVPADDYEHHKAELERMACSQNEELAARAKAALAKLRKSSLTRDQIKTQQAAYTHVAMQTVKDGVCRAGERSMQGILAEAGMLVIGGAVWELRDAATNPSELTIWQRFERFLGIFWKKLISSAVLRAGKEFALEALHLLFGVLRSVFKSAGALLSTLAKGISTVWESIYDYLTGKIESFSQLVSIILKTLTTVGIGTLAFTLEQQLTALGIPGMLSGLMAAALAGVAVVFANRSIDATIFTLTNLFSCTEASRLRREQIEAVCREALPRLRTQRRALEASLQKYYAERTRLFRSNFTDLREALASRDSMRTCMALESLNQAFGCTLGWKTDKEFDDMMESEDPFIL